MVVCATVSKQERAYLAVFFLSTSKVTLHQVTLNIDSRLFHFSVFETDWRIFSSEWILYRVKNDHNFKIKMLSMKLFQKLMVSVVYGSLISYSLGDSDSLSQFEKDFWHSSKKIFEILKDCFAIFNQHLQSKFFVSHIPSTYDQIHWNYSILFSLGYSIPKENSNYLGLLFLGDDEVFLGGTPYIPWVDENGHRFIIYLNCWLQH